MLHDPDPRDDSHFLASTGAPDELSPAMTAWLEEIYAEPDPLSEAELEEIAAADAERWMGEEIHRALAAGPRPLAEVWAEVFGQRRAS